MAIAGGQVELSADKLIEFANHPLHDGDVRTLLICIAFTWFMALFPDVDTESRPRKMFHRAAFVAITILWYFNAYDLMALFALVAIAPLLHKHRGWTHARLTPWFFALIFAVAWEYARVQQGWFRSFSWENVLDFLTLRWIFVAAIIAGHYTHLFLDLPVFSYFKRRLS